ncbi:MAG: hypothetical protein WDM81_14510 [Rhizomicrobium sp.]
MMDAPNTFNHPAVLKPADFQGVALAGGSLAVAPPAKSVVVPELI